MSYYLKLENLSVGYNGKPVIRDIELGIEQGEIVTLIGPNGAGKSTILKTITRQLASIGGLIEFSGKHIQDYSYRELSSRMAVVLTERMKPELMTCHDIVATGRYPYTGRLGILTPEDEAKVDEAMRAVHADDLGSRDFNAISDGQRQRVLLARAICQEPDIILLDEPTSFLDVRYKLELLSILRKMAKEKGITVVMSLHEIDLAMKISDRILCVKGDHIFRFGTPEEIFAEETIRDLYEIDNGFFDPTFGSIEMPKPTGEPRILVLSNCGSGIPVFRNLQRQNAAFIAGGFFENETDYRLATYLAAETIAEKSCEPMSEETCEKLLQAVKRCDRVINAGLTIGSTNTPLRAVLEAARQSGKLDTL